MPAPALEPLLDWGRSLGVAGEPAVVARRPWSTTARVGDVWLKACGPGGRHEAGLLGGLLWWGAPHAVLPLAVDAAQGFAALPHAGSPLREAAPGHDRWPALLAEHAALQRRLQRHADDALALGVPDLRPEDVAPALQALLDRHPVDEDLRRRLDGALPDLARRGAALAAGPVGPCVQHDDLHDGNLLVDDAGAVRAVDWGDSAVGHPFGLLLVTLRVLRHGGLDDAGAERLRDAYLGAWTDLAPLPELRAVAADAQLLQHVGRALAWERALSTADDAERAPYADPVTGWLELLADALSD